MVSKCGMECCKTMFQQNLQFYGIIVIIIIIIIIDIICCSKYHNNNVNKLPLATYKMLSTQVKPKKWMEVMWPDCVFKSPFMINKLFIFIHVEKKH